jgi:hypothetical protein
MGVMNTTTTKEMPVSVRFSTDSLKDVDSAAEATKLSRVDVIRLSVVVGLPKLVRTFGRGRGRAGRVGRGVHGKVARAAGAGREAA